jgi:thiol:disulfide interchange protein DsbC
MTRVIALIAGLASLLVMTHGMADAKSDVAKAFNKFIPELKVTTENIRKTPVKDIYEVTVGPRVYYISVDGRYLFDGTMLDLAKKKDLTAPQVAKARVKTVNGIGEDKMFVYKPKGETKHTITVFTDLDCPYCREMHRRVSEYNALGIKVRYLLYPRSQVNSPLFNKAIAVWCAKDRNKEFTKAKAGKPIQQKLCKNHPILEHVRVGRAMGVQGTPAIVLDNGTVLPGYVQPKELFKELNKKKDAKVSKQ